MWRCRVDATTRKSTPTTEPTLHRDLSATFRTDPRWKRVGNPRRTRSNRLPHQAKRTNLRKQKVTASADSPGVALQHAFRGDVSVQLPVPKAPLFSWSAQNRLGGARRGRIRLG